MKKKAQSILEYTLILGIVAAALGAMQLYFRRGIQAAIKLTADRIGLQQGAVELDPQKGTKESSSITQTTRGPGSGGKAVQQTIMAADGGVSSSFNRTTTTTGESSYEQEKEQ